MSSIQKPPTRLVDGGPGRELWSAMVEVWELDPAERRILMDACMCADDMAALDRVVEIEGFSVEGSVGQTRVNPAVAERRMQRLAMVRLLGSLGLADAVREEPSTTATQAARTALRAVR